MNDWFRGSLAAGVFADCPITLSLVPSRVETQGKINLKTHK